LASVLPDLSPYLLSHHHLFVKYISFGFILKGKKMRRGLKEQQQTMTTLMLRRYEGRQGRLSDTRK
jgi:hypothetical protein